MSAYLSRLDALNNRNRLLITALVLMLIFNLYNWNGLRTALVSSRVALVPMIGSTGMWVGNGRASDEYLRAMARYVTAQVGTYSAGSYRSQLQELLLLFPPDTVGQAQTEFLKLADEVERFPSISSVVQWVGQTPLKYVDNMMQIQALKTRLVNGQVTETLQTFYCVEYRVEDTQFQIRRTDELSGSGTDLCVNKYVDLHPNQSKNPATSAPMKPPREMTP